MIIGYARPIAADPDCALQEATLREAGCDRIERQPGTILAALEEGDSLVVAQLATLAGSVDQLRAALREIRTAKAYLRVLEPAIDTASEGGIHFAFHLKAVAKFLADTAEIAERENWRERQRAGIAKRKAVGGYPGRKPSVPAALIRKLDAQGVPRAEIVRRLGISRTSVYRVLKAELKGEVIPFPER